MLIMLLRAGHGREQLLHETAGECSHNAAAHPSRQHDGSGRLYRNEWQLGRPAAGNMQLQRGSGADLFDPLIKRSNSAFGGMCNDMRCNLGSDEGLPPVAVIKNTVFPFASLAAVARVREVVESHVANLPIRHQTLAALVHEKTVLPLCSNLAAFSKEPSPFTAYLAALPLSVVDAPCGVVVLARTVLQVTQPLALELAAVRVGAAARRVRLWSEQSAGKCNDSPHRQNALQHEDRHLHAASLPLVVAELTFKDTAISIMAFAFAVAACAVAPQALERAAIRIMTSALSLPPVVAQFADETLTIS
jgi:hypothetical protein